MATAREDKLTQPLKSSSPNRLYVTILVASLILGAGAGYFLAHRNGSSSTAQSLANIASKPSNPTQDRKTFRDFAEGKITKRPDPKGKADQYAEGTHLLLREGATPVALTSSVVDLSQYEGKQVKVYGETQKALKEGWLMDVGLVEETK